jgi:hypothetical protein
MKRPDKARASVEPPAHQVRLPGFVTGQEIGLGDVFRHVTHSIGISPCGGCRRRAEALNRWLVFTGRTR